jgi:LysM repeat protein
MLAIVTRDYKIIPQSSNPLVSADSTKNNNSEIALANKASNATDSTSLKKEKQSDVSLNKQSKTKFIYYTVQRGDTLWSIANRKGVTVDELKKLNNLRSSIPLKAGVKLKISVKG